MAATLAAGLFFYSSCTPAEKTDTKDYTQYVNTFIGGADNGHTFPGACYPFGMIQTSPVTGAVGWRYCSEYVYEDSLIWGFTQTHLNGTGCMDLGDILVMPVTGTRARAWDAYRSHFPKDKEAATPGYYTAELSDPQVKAELTASIHAALHRYTYHKADSASILIDLQHGPAWREEQYHSQVNSCEVNWEDAQTLTGHVNNTVWVNQDYFFVMKFNRPVVDSLYLPMGETEKGKRIIASFDMQPGDELMMKVALSTTSIDGAKKNLEAEIPAWDFEGVRATAHNEWNNYLSRIEIEGTDDEKTNFYTCFYHALIQPNQISDVDGMYRNAADSIVKAGTGAFYSTFSLWDTYRAAHPFYTLVIPERVDGFVNSLIEQGEVQGFLPIWGLWGKENFCMIGNHGVSVIAEAYRKGFRGFDAERAFNIIKKTQTVSHPLKSDWEVYTKYGYFPTDLIKAESVSSTLESVYDDYAAADVAAWAGASFKKGGEDGVVQSSTLCFSFANVDSYHYNLIGPSLHTSNKNSPIYDVIKSGKYPLIDKHFNSNLIGPDVVQFNAGHIDNIDSTDPWATTRAMATGRQIAEQYLEALKEVRPKAFGSAFVVKTASLLGVRDSRRIEGDYTFTFQDWLERKTFEDEIGRNCYYIDVHKPGHKETRYKKGESHGIPYRCLTPKGLKNLLVAGRCISTDEEAFGSLRVMPPCLVTGEAAGMAAVHAIKQTRNDVHKIDTVLLRKRLKEEGQYFL